jgi:hypothetical protein
MILADALLSLCNINVRPDQIIDPTTGNQIQSKGKNPVTPLLESSRRWLEWELYRESIRLETTRDTLTGIGDGCHDTIASCAILSLSYLSILRQVTTNIAVASDGIGVNNGIDPATTAQFYIHIFDEKPLRNAVTRAAAAQAMACVSCAADRMDDESSVPLGLLSAVEFLLDRINGKLLVFMSRYISNRPLLSNSDVLQIQAHLQVCARLLPSSCSIPVLAKCAQCNVSVLLAVEKISARRLLVFMVAR